MATFAMVVISWALVIVVLPVVLVSFRTPAATAFSTRRVTTVGVTFFFVFCLVYVQGFFSVEETVDYFNAVGF